MTTNDWLAAMRAIVELAPELRGVMQKRLEIAQQAKAYCNVHGLEFDLRLYGGECFTRCEGENDVIRAEGVSFVTQKTVCSVSIPWHFLLNGNEEEVFAAAAVQLRLRESAGESFTHLWYGTGEPLFKEHNVRRDQNAPAHAFYH